MLSKISLSIHVITVLTINTWRLYPFPWNRLILWPIECHGCVPIPVIILDIKKPSSFHVYSVEAIILSIQFCKKYQASHIKKPLRVEIPSCIFQPSSALATISWMSDPSQHLAEQKNYHPSQKFVINKQSSVVFSCYVSKRLLCSHR